ncbi:MAG: tetratricopeptide repeat protein [Spirochaetes bacterium]|nr:tetratricopeptide repeat protein [Spirochaetota bacterium]
MKKTLAIYSCIIAAFIAGAFVYAQFVTNTDKGQDGRPKNKVTYKNYIWIEGENAVSTNFAREPIYNFFCSNRFALQLAKDVDPPADGYYANYVFYVTHTKEYDLWLGCTPPGSMYHDRPGYASPIEWKVDNGPFQSASAENVYVKDFYGIGGFYWVKIATGTLNAGKHNLTIRVKQKRSSGWDYYFYIDAILFLPHYSIDIAELMNFPEVAPKNFTTPGEGILFDDINEYEKKIRTNINDRGTLFTLVQIYGWLYDYNKAIVLLQRYLEKNPRDIQMRLLLAANYSWSDQLDAAINEYKNIIAIDEKNITARKLLSVLAGWNNRYDEAIQYYQQIIAIEPDNVDAYISLATQYSWKGEMDKAIVTFEKAESIAPDNVAVLEALGDNYYWLGRTYDAIRQYYRIIDLDEKNISAYKKLAKIYLDVGETAKASRVINDAKQIIDLYPELSGISLDVKDELAKERRELINSYKEALVKTPEDVNLRKGLIDTYIWNKMHSDAVKEYDTLLTYKMFHSIEASEQKLTRLIIHTAGLQAAKPVIASIKNDLSNISKRYAKHIENQKSGKTVVDDAQLSHDMALLKSYNDRLKAVQHELQLYNDITAALSKDVQTYMAMQAATGWHFEPGRIGNYADTAMNMYPQMYQPYKVKGTVALFYGKPSDAVTGFEKVKQLTGNVSPTLSLACAQTKDYKGAIVTLEESLQNKTIASAYKLDIEMVVSMASLPGPEVTRTQSSLPDIENALADMHAIIDSVAHELEQKVVSGLTTMREVYEKGFLDLEQENVRIYKEIANYYMQKGNYNASRDYYNNILKVQPLNVEVNFSMGNINELLGYWKDAEKNYEICINAQPDFEYARKAHYQLQILHAPSLTPDIHYFSDNSIDRYSAGLSCGYELNQFLGLRAGYSYGKQTDKGGISTTGQLFYPSEGDVDMQKVFVEAEIPVRMLYSQLFLNINGTFYSGTVDYGNPLYDTSLSYFSPGYGAGIIITPPATGVTLKLTYHHDDENDLTQSLKMKFRDAITYDSFEGVLDINFYEYNFPLSDRISLFNAVEYRKLSDSNTRLSSFNQFTFRLYRIPKINMVFDLAGIYSYEDTDFNKYSSGDILLVPYWAPMGVSYYGPMLKVSQQIDNLFKGGLYYSLFVEYLYNSLEQKSVMPGISLVQTWDKIQIFMDYIYTSVTLPDSATEDTYVSHDFRFGATGKFFTIYTPKGAGGKPILFVSANPILITPDGDGKDDFTTLNLTAFDEKGISQWWIEILNEKGEKIQEYSMAGAVPATYRWDGTNRMNVLAPEGEYYVQLSIQNTAGERFTSKKQEVFLATAKRAIALTPSYKEFSPNGDKVKDMVSFTILATDKKNVNSWFMTISSKNRVIKTIRGNDFIPYDVMWDGNDDSLKVANDGEYSIVMTMQYDDGITIKSAAATVTVVTRVTVDIKVEPAEIVPAQGTLRIMPAVDGKIEQWQVRILRDDGALLKIINGAGMPPKVVAWDGTDEKGEPVAYNMPAKVEMEVTDTAGNTSLSNKVPFMIGFLMKQEKGKRVLYVFNQDIMFKGRSDELTGTGVFVLGHLQAKLATISGFTTLSIVAYTDDVGSSQSNMELSQKQAQVIAANMKGVNAQIKALGAGSQILYLKDKPSKWDMRYEIELY